ncbi:MAG: ABC transporter permease [Planctomycetes bacterium]|nr:ABC transporter permease [Planctomycetota bacterium]
MTRSPAAGPPTARPALDEPAPEVDLAVADPLDAAVGEALLRAAADLPPGRPARLDLSRVRRADTFGLAAVAAALRGLRAGGRAVRVVGLDPEVRRRAALLRLDEVLAARDEDPPGPAAVPGGRLRGALDHAVVLLATLYLGVRHAAADCFRTPLGREQLARQVVEVGQRGVPIVAGVTFLIGAIIAIQTAYTLEPYGATIYVARGVGISMTRELGPLMAAVLVAARSGSAIAAELGSMVVYEEVEALEMMALRPRRFLLSPRFAALLIGVPALSVCADIAGVVGGATIMVLQYDITPRMYFDETIRAVYLADIGSGLIKSVFFGALIAAVACKCGLSLRGGPEAVGRAATAAVVQSIVAVVLFDAAFTYASRGVL